METMLRSVAMSGYFDVTRRVGLNPVELAQQVGIDTAALANPDDRIPAAAACRLLALTAEKAACPTFALQMAETRQKFGTGVVNLLLAHKRTLREVLLATVEYRHLLNEALGKIKGFSIEIKKSRDYTKIQSVMERRRRISEYIENKLKK